MSASLGLSPKLIAYLAAANRAEHPALAKCRAETTVLLEAQMQISAEQGAFMAMLARLVGAKRAFEIGVFTGYSALAIALELKAMHGAGAHLLACDISKEWTDRARAYWRAAGIDDVVDLQLAPALETMDARIAAGEGGSYDFGFIDADKTGYDSYYERGLDLLRPGGLMLFDNVLWSGRVADPADTTPDTKALRALAQKAKTDARTHAVLVAVGDGLLMVMKR
jgi:caffeoyl-CoA O-methyltransferase